jgi:hypothetical protein
MQCNGGAGWPCSRPEVSTPAGYCSGYGFVCHSPEYGSLSILTVKRGLPLDDVQEVKLIHNDMQDLGMSGGRHSVDNALFIARD